MAISPDTPEKITYFAETDYRSKRVKFGIRDDDRAKHMYIIGKTGMGKSTMLENLAVQDIQNGEGLCFIDPHGGTAETILSYVPEHRIKDVIYFAPFDQEFPVALNVMEDMGKDKRPLIASGLIGAFKKVWVDAWSARMEYLLSNALLALFETPGSTLLGVNRMFADKNFRNMIVANVTDPSVRSFWVDEFAKYSDKFATEATAAIQNKIGQFAANPLIRNMVGQPKSTFDIRQVMDERKILIVNLSKGRMGEGNANLVGSMLITKIYLAAMSRADVGAEVVKGLPAFYLYVDEFQSFANESFADILSEARKYKLSLTIAHQYIEQMSEEVRAAVFGNVGSMVSFRVGAYDAEVLEKEFAPAFTAEDMVNLGFAQIYLKLMIRGVGSSPFSAVTLPPVKKPVRDYAPDVIASSRELFARPREQVEEEIKKWHEPIPDAPRDPNARMVPETRKYAPGTRPRSDSSPVSAPFRPSGASAQNGRGEQRQANPNELRSVLQSVLPQEQKKDEPKAEVSLPAIPSLSISAKNDEKKIVIPRAPYSPLSITPSAIKDDLGKVHTPADSLESPKSKPKLVIPKPPKEEQTIIPASPQTPPPQRLPTPPIHRPFAEQFAKLNTTERAPDPRPDQTNPSPGQPQPTPKGDSRSFSSRNEEQRNQARNTRPASKSFTPSERRTDAITPPAQSPMNNRPINNNSQQTEPSKDNERKATPQSVSLSALKTSAKRDRGPSEAHLSSLRDVLRSVSSESRTTQPKKEEEQPKAPPQTHATLPEIKRNEMLPPSEEVEFHSEEYVSQEKPSISSSQNAVPPRQEKQPLRQMEIPEDVLRGVLSD